MNDDIQKGQTKSPSPSKTMGQSEKTAAGNATAKGYINRYLVEESPLGDETVGTFDDITMEHIEGEHLKNFFYGFCYWLATTAFFTSHKTYLSTSNKETYFKRAKMALKEKFPDHDLFGLQHVEWFAELKAKFMKECNRSRSEDAEIAEERKSEPLYRDLSTELTAVRAKYLGLNRVDAKTIAMSMIKMASDFRSSAVLAEFTISRSAIGRGGEHVFLRWDEGTYDPYFQAPDFDWSIIKQNDRQCMLIFCDVALYQLCPFFAFGVYFMFGGLRRDNVSEATKNFVFPYLHKMKKDSVASKMTASIRAHIEHEERKKAFTSRSMRKGAMTENRMNRDLSLTEEYARSGHTAQTMNSNAEGYIETNPAINSPGGLAVAGYTNCHMSPTPYGFDCLGYEAFSTVQAFVTELFVNNDIPSLQENGKLRPVIMISAARIVGSYRDLIRDVGLDYPIVRAVMEAARRAKVDDEQVKEAGNPRYHIVLRSWSDAITKSFIECNQQTSPIDPNVNEELLRSLILRVGRLEDALTQRGEFDNMVQILRDEHRIQNSQLNEKDRTIKHQKEEIKRLRSMLKIATNQSISPYQSPQKPKAAQDESDTTRTPKEAEKSSFKAEITLEPSPPKKQKLSTNTSDATISSVASSLDGVPQMSAAVQGVGGITILDEMERLWANNRDEGMLPKRVLFDRKHPLFHSVHPAFVHNSEGAKYTGGMTLVALSMSDDNWKQLCKGTLEGLNKRKLFASVQNDAMAKTYEFEVQLGLKDPNKTSKANPTIHSLGTRFAAIVKKWKKDNHSEDFNSFIDLKLGGDGKIQSKITTLLKGGAKKSKN